MPSSELESRHRRRGQGCARRWGMLGVAWLIFTIRVAAADVWSAEGQTYTATLFGIEQGLPHLEVTALAQAKDGCLWIGTSSGLAYFDGARFHSLRAASAPGLTHNLIRAIEPDDEGTLWIATYAGLSRMVNGRIEQVAATRVPVDAVTRDRGGRIWVGTRGQGLQELHEGRLVAHPATALLMPDAEVRALLSDAQGRLWISLRDGRVICRSPDGGEQAWPIGSPEGGVVLAMAETPNGDMWFACDHGGLKRLRGGELTNIGHDGILRGSRVIRVSVDAKGRLWVLDRGVAVLSPGAEQLQRLDIDETMKPKAVLIDREGSLWLGTSEAGLAHVRPQSLRLVGWRQGLPDGAARSVTMDAEGNIWAAFPEHGVVRMAPGRPPERVYQWPGEAGSVWSVLSARDGRLWIGRRGTLLVRQRETTLEEVPDVRGVRVLFEDRAGAIWLGTERDGVMRYRDGGYENVSAAMGIDPAWKVRSIAEGPDGAMYFGLLTQGLVRVRRDGTRVHWHRGAGQPLGEVRAIHPDAEGNVWVGVRGTGLVVYAGETWHHSESLAEPFNDYVAAIAEDREGRLWLASPKGIVWASKAVLLALARGQQHSGTLFLGGREEGLFGGQSGLVVSMMNNTGEPSTWRTPEGKIWFAVTAGLIEADPRSVPANEQPPPVRIDRVNETPAWAQTSVRLPPGTRALTIDYTAPSFLRVERMLFRYRLEGYDAGWVEAGSRRTAYYTNLEPGTYRFQVIAANGDGVWNTLGATIAVTIAPYFYQTGWFRGLLVMALLGGGVLVFRVRMRRHERRAAALQQQNAELERRVVERTTELARSYESLRVSEYFYHSLVESLPQLIVRKDPEGRITYANAAYAEIIDRPLADVIGKTDVDLFSAERGQRYRADDLSVLAQRKTMERETILERHGRRVYLHVKKVPLYDEADHPIGVQVLFWDITAFRETEEKLKAAQAELLETSRLAGMAEVATGVLHNIGNALNSVNTAATVTHDRIRRMRLENLDRLARMLGEQGERLGEFVTQDPRGKLVPGFLGNLAVHLQADREDALRELHALRDGVEHVKQIVAMQQSFARVAGVAEQVPPAELVEFALRISETAIAEAGVDVKRMFAPTAAVNVPRQKVVQILVNLVRNACDAMQLQPPGERRLSITIGPASKPDVVQIFVTDTGCGIAPENLTRIFAFGYTTKKHGHGFGLHSSALAAREVGGSLVARSNGPGTGATFALELPLTPSVSGELSPPQENLVGRN